MRVSFTVGTALDKDDKPVTDVLKKRDIALTYLAKRYGGCTMTNGEGAWINPGTGILITEPSIIFTCEIADKPDVPPEWHNNSVWQAGHFLRSLFNQSSVMLSTLPTSTQFIETGTMIA